MNHAEVLNVEMKCRNRKDEEMLEEDPASAHVIGSGLFH